MLVSINGDIFTKDQAKISVFDRSFLFGDSVYEVTKSVNGRPQFLEEHLDRLENSAFLIDIPFRGIRNKIKNNLLSLNKKLSLDEAYFRIIITRGVSYSCNIGSTDSAPNIIIIAKKLTPYPSDWYEKGVSLMVSKFRRNHQRCLDPNAKSGNYLNNILALNEAKKAGFYDAIMLNLDNKVAESTTSNIWFIKNGIIYSPEDQSGLLKGITRKILFKVCRDMNLEVVLRPVTMRDLEGADELFISSATKEIIPVTKLRTSIDKDFKIGKLTKDLMKKYRIESTKVDSLS